MQQWPGQEISAAPQAPTSPSRPQSSAPQSSTPRGIRNNNPGNIEDGPYARSLPGYTGSDGRFATFETPDAGGAAKDRLLGSYIDRGFNTPNKIINRWAPPSENDSAGYARFVADKVGIGPDDVVTADMIPAISAAIYEMENGRPMPGGSPQDQSWPGQEWSGEEIGDQPSAGSTVDENGFIVAGPDGQWGSRRYPWTEASIQAADGDAKPGDYFTFIDEQGNPQTTRIAVQGVGVGPERQLPSGVRIRETGLLNDIGAFSTAFNEQLPWGDELTARTVSALEGGSYDEARQRQELEREAAREMDSGARTAGGLGGFGATMLLPGAAAGWIGRGTGVGGRAARAAGVGGATGAVYGSGAADDGLGERLTGGAVGGAAGGVLGAAAQPLVEGVTAAAPRVAAGIEEAGNRVRGLLGRNVPEAEITPEATNAATEYVRGILERSGGALDSAAEVRGKPITAAEAIGPLGEQNVTSLARRSGATPMRAAEQLITRNREAPQRLLEDFAGVSGVDPRDAFGVVQSISDRGRRVAGPLYEKAYAQSVELTPELAEILATPAGRQAMNRARTIAANERRNPDDLGFVLDDAGEVSMSATPSVQTLDYVKRGLDSVLDDFRNPVTRKLSLDTQSRPVAGLASEFRNGLIEATGGAEGAYSRALQAAGEPIRIEQAFNDAERLMGQSTRVRDFSDRVGRMSQGERDALLSGIADNALRLVERGQLRASQLQRGSHLGEKIEVLIGPERAADFMDRIGDEAAMFASGGRMAPGSNSTTAEALNAAADQAGAESLGGILADNLVRGDIKGGLLGTIGQAVGAPVSGFVRGFNAPQGAAVRDEIGRLLLMSPSELEGVLGASMPPVSLRAPSVANTNRSGVLGGSLVGSS